MDFEKSQCVNRVIDSLDVRVIRETVPSKWLLDQSLKWQTHKDLAKKERVDPLFSEIPEVGTFRLILGASNPYQFALDCPEICHIRIWNLEKWRSAYNGQTGQIYISFASVYLQRFGLPGARKVINNLKQCFLQNPEVIGIERVSIIDITGDYDNVEINPSELDRFVTRARLVKQKASEQQQTLNEIAQAISNTLHDGAELSQEHLHWLSCNLRAIAPVESALNWVVSRSAKLQTVYFGSFRSPISCRLYDKLASLKVQNKEYLKEIWQENGWDRESPVWRVEFHLTGQFLESAGLHLDEDLAIIDLRDFDAIAGVIESLWQYCTNKWLRHVYPNSTDSNKRRWRISSWWEVVRKTFQGFSGWSEPIQRTCSQTISRVSHFKTRLRSLFAQGRGVFASLLAMIQKSDRDANWTSDYIWWELFDLDLGLLNRKDFLEKVVERRQKYGIDDYTLAVLPGHDRNHVKSDIRAVGETYLANYIRRWRIQHYGAT